MSDFDDRMAALRRRYVDRRDSELAQLAAAATSGDRDALSARAHALAGSSAVFGFASVGTAARDLEQALGAGGDWRPLLDRLVDQLRAVA